MNFVEKVNLRFLLKVLKRGYDNSIRNSEVRIDAIEKEVEDNYKYFIDKLEEELK